VTGGVQAALETETVALVTVLIVNWNTRALVTQCLRTVADNARQMESGQVHILVVDNGSSDASVEAVTHEFPDVEVIANEDNVGFAAANNQGLSASTSEFVLLLNSDTLLSEGVLAELTQFMQNHPRVGVVGCQLVNSDGTPQASVADFPSLLSAITGNDFRQHRRLFINDALEVDAIVGACLMVRRRAIEQVGPMDDAFTFFAEEMDWCYRMRQHGWLVCWLPSARVIHLLGQSRKQRPWFAYMNLHRSRILFFRKHYGPARAHILRLGYVGAAIIKVCYHAARTILRRPSARRKLGQNLRLIRWLLLEQDVLN
jgi:N-acetylglucosaminyl-diphospho-decaprenol L-rhamnosyltransferase